MKNDEGWDRVAKVIRGLTKDAATMAEKVEILGVSDHTVRKLEAGEPVVHAKAIGTLTRTLGWPIDALDQIRAGRSVSSFTKTAPPPPDELAEIRARLDDIEARLDQAKIAPVRHLRAADAPGAVDPGPVGKASSTKRRGAGRAEQDPE